MSSTEPRAPQEAASNPDPPRRRDAIARRVVAAGLQHRQRHPVLSRLLVTVLAVCVALVVTGMVGAVTDLDLATGAAMSIVILGLSFLTGFSGQVSLGNGAFFGVGCYVFAIWANHNNSSIGEDLLVCTAAGALAGLIVGLPATRLRGPYLAGMTIAVAIAFGSLIDQFSTWTNGDQGLDVQSPVTPPAWLAHFIGAPISSLRATTMWRADITVVVAGIAFFFMANLFQSRRGRAMRLMRENEVADSTVFGSTFSLALSIQILTLLVIGGIGTISGSLIGGLLYAYSITWIASLVSGVGLTPASNLGSEMNNIIFGALLIITVLVAPLGIAGTLRFVISRRTASRRQQT